MTASLWDPGSVTAIAESAEAAAVCSACGELRRLDLDPRLFRHGDPDRLASNILEAADNAAANAAELAFAAGREFLPATARPDTVDFSLDPLLRELDRLIADGEPPGDDDPALPKLAAGIDYQAVRRNLAAVRERLPDLRTTAESADGLMSATVDGRGRLVDLWLHERVLRVTDAKALAARVRATVNEASRAAHDRQRVLVERAWE
ncbi:YbaB/EbfC family nucleoid-associated protein [Amycolatopsis sp. WGS_07]|uniref:YbaB/EbfC family nucleoid-associated protein n=1 Tax=Amycolatopsis sp. WGS_07 TaxID=3076764 RepID=UPI003873BD7A